MRIHHKLIPLPGGRPAAGLAPEDIDTNRLRATMREVRALDAARQLAAGLRARRRKPNLLQRLVLSAEDLRQHDALLDAIAEAQPLIQRLHDVAEMPLVHMMAQEPERSLLFGLVGARSPR